MHIVGSRGGTCRVYIVDRTVDPDTTATPAHRNFDDSLDGVLEARPWSHGLSLAHQMKFHEARVFHSPYVLEYIEDELGMGRARVLDATLEIVPDASKSGGTSRSDGTDRERKIERKREEKDIFTEDRLFRLRIPNFRYMTKRQRAGAVKALDMHQ